MAPRRRPPARSSAPRTDSASRAVIQVPTGRREGPAGLRRKDGWENLYTGLRTGRDKRTGTSVAFDKLSYQECEELWRGDDMAAKIVEEPAREMLRKWLDVQINPDDDENDEKVQQAKEASEEVEGELKRLDARRRVREAVMRQRAFGGGVLLMGVSDGEVDLLQPLNEKNLQSVDFLTAFDAYEVWPRTYYLDPTEDKYGEPETYWVYPQGVPGGLYTGMNATKASIATTTALHESRLLRFEGQKISRRQARENRGWPDSVFVRVKDVLADFGMGWGGAAALLADFSQAVFKMHGLADAIATGNEALVIQRLEMMEMSRSMLRAVLLDAGDGANTQPEDFERKQTPVTGLPDLLDRLCNRLAAAADMPVTRLMGQSPAGLNATGDQDESWWFDRIIGLQDEVLTKPLERLIHLLFVAKKGPMKGVEPKNWSIQYRPLKELDPIQEATRRLTVAQADALYVTNQVVTPEEVAISRFGGDQYSADTKIDKDLRDRFNEMVAPEERLGAPNENEQMQQEAAAKTAQANAKEAAKPKPPPGAGGGGSDGPGGGGNKITLHVKTTDDNAVGNPNHDKRGRFAARGGGGPGVPMVAKFGRMEYEARPVPGSNGAQHHVFARPEGGSWQQIAHGVTHESAKQAMVAHSEREAGRSPLDYQPTAGRAMQIAKERQALIGRPRSAVALAQGSARPPSRIPWPTHADTDPEHVLAALAPSDRAKYNDIVADVEAKAAEGKETYKVHSVNGDGTGGYTPERQAIHERILDATFAGSDRFKPRDGGKPSVILLGGRGGAGKSKLGKAPINAYSKDTHLVLDPDNFKAALPDYDPTKAYLFHQESSDLFRMSVEVARERGLNTVLDITMEKPKTALSSIEKFRRDGYSVEAHYMHLPPAKAAERALDRWRKGEGGQQDAAGNPVPHTGRLVPVPVVLDMKTNEQTFDEVRPLVDRWSAYTNDVPEGEPPRLLAKKE